MGGLFGTAMLLASVLSLLTGPARLDANGDPLPAGALLRLGSVRWRHGTTVRGVIFTDGGKTLITGSADKTIAVRDVKTGKLLRRWKAHDVAINALALSPDGKTLASATRTGGLRLWDPATGKEIASLPDNKGAIIALAFSPDSKILAWGGVGKQLRLWDVARGKELLQIAAPTDEVGCLAFSPDGKTLASGGENDNILHLWDVATGKELQRFEGHKGDLTAVLFTDDGKTLISSSVDNTIRFWDVETCVETRTLQSGLKELIWSIALSPDCKFLAYGAGGPKPPEISIHLWEIATGKEVRSLAGHRIFVCALAFSPDGKTLASGGWDCIVRLWDVATGKELNAQPGHQGQVNTLAYSPDGKTLASGGTDSVIRLWDPAEGKEIKALEGHKGRIASVVFSPDGQLLASGSYDNSVRLWDPARGKPIRTLNGHTSPVNSVAFSPDSKTLASSSHDYSLRQWETATGKEQGVIGDRSKYWYSTAYSPRGSLLAASVNDDDRAVAVWEPVEGREVGRFTNPAGFTYAAQLAVAPTGRMVALVGGGGTTIHLYELGSGKERLEFAKHTSDVVALAIAPDGRMLASADRDCVLHLWDMATGKELRRLKGHEGFVTALGFAPDGKTLASSSTDTTLLLWDVADLARREPAKATMTREELPNAWDALANADSAKAYRAIRALTASPEQAVSLLRERLRPAKPADARLVAKLLKDLDSDDFEVREKATKELEQFGDGIEAALQKAKEGQPSAEAAERIKSLLDRVQSDTTPDHLRMLRAFEALEDLDTPEARQLLRTLAETEPGDRVTREAKEVLARMRKRPGGKP